MYSSPDAILSRITQESLFPDNAYVHDSGGTPHKIPDMTFESLCSFHSTFYHPSNSKIFFYGDDDPAKRLELLDVYLRDFSKSPHSEIFKSPVQYQRRFSAPKVVVDEYPTAASDEMKHMYTLNWVLNEKDFSLRDRLSMSVLNHLLFATADSVMRKTLME